MNGFHRIAQRVAHTGRRVLAHRPLAAAFLRALAPSITIAMTGLAVGRFAVGDTSAGFALAAAGATAALWGLAEYRAETAYETGWSAGVDATRNATADLLADALQSIGEAAATAQRAQEGEDSEL